MGEIVIGVFIIILAILIYTNSGDFPQLEEPVLDAGSYPRLIAVILAILAVILIIRKGMELYKSQAERSGMGIRAYTAYVLKEYKLVFLILAMFAVYVGLIDIIGFIVTTIAFIIAAGLTVGPTTKRNAVVMSIVAVVLTLGMYFFFETALHVRFPTGILI
ncbi:tripartite tricarboxylate transporter TctB family protein [Salsuginibacillus halophilus]|uniref:Tripartite tricarboxylate transporter TctB family protein n=1 Tax=Salsuginibacillus halophilus TaxID=517424 RepID=A0A2P8H9A8_9BACI|nr:tripartite tricarboxylate transporter TctB family protein [Salsuginibacillus halophilus]PSL42770.1 tripartite tricarboxylate transporter TctB family protein [Salsuginibacillus halophilus]